MITPDGWQVELLRYAGQPVFRVTCHADGARGQGVVVSLGELVSVLGDSFELLDLPQLLTDDGSRDALV